MQKNTENIDPKVFATSNGKTMILSKCAICGSKKSRYIYRNELDKACFQYDMAYLAKRTAADKVLKNEAFNIAKNAK